MLVPFYAVVADGIVTFWITVFLLAFLVCANLFLDAVLLGIEAAAGGAFPVPTFLWFLLAVGPLAVGEDLVFCVPSYSHLSTPHQGPHRTLSLLSILLLLFDWAVVLLFAEAQLCHGMHGITDPA